MGGQSGTGGQGQGWDACACFVSHSRICWTTVLLALRCCLAGVPLRFCPALPGVSRSIVSACSVFILLLAALLLQVRDLVRSLRPGVKDANMTPPQACASLALMFSRQADSKQYFLSEGGVLAALELLDSDQPKCAEAALDLVLAFTANDTRLLEGLCLVGLVPLVCRLTWAGAGHAGSGVAASSSVGGGPGAGHERLRLKAAQLVQQLCCARETTLQMLIACGGLGWVC